MLEAETAGFGASGRNGGWCSALFPASLGDRSRALPGSSPRRARWRSTGRCAPPSTRCSRWPTPRASTPRPTRAARSSLARSALPAAPRPRRGRRTPAPGVVARTTSRCSTRPRPAPGSTATGDARRHLHPRLRRDAPGAAGARAGPGRRAPRRADPRADPGRARSSRAGPSPTTARSAPTWWCGRPRATPASLRDDAARRGAGLLAGRRHRAAARRRSGSRSGCATGRRSPTTAPDHLRPAHRRRPAGLRRSRGAVPLRLGDQPGLRPRAAGVRDAARTRCSSCCPVAGRARRFTHAWGGALGVPRDWVASVGLDRATGLGWAGGYVGDGVGTTNLAGRTLRDLVLGRDTELTRLPWVGHRSRRWEPEPLRWLGRQRRAAGDDVRRRRGAPHRAAQPRGPADGPAGGRALTRPAPLPIRAFRYFVVSTSRIVVGSIRLPTAPEGKRPHGHDLRDACACPGHVPRHRRRPRRRVHAS